VYNKPNGCSATGALITNPTRGRTCGAPEPSAIKLDQQLRSFKESYSQNRKNFHHFFYPCTVHLDIIKVFHSTTDAPFISPKKL
jgi:hypothetical protein